MASAADKGPSAKKPRKALKESLEKGKEKRAVNKEPQQAQSIPEGKACLDFFPEGGPNKHGWPKLHDRQCKVPQKMCLKHQVKRARTTGCTLAHVPKSRLSKRHETEITAPFKSEDAGCWKTRRIHLS